MISREFQTKICHLIVFAAVIFGNACTKRTREPGQLSIADVAALTGVVFPSDAHEVFYTSSRRYPDYREWVFYSKGQFKMPPQHNAFGDYYVTNSLDIAVQYVQFNITNKIDAPKLAFSSDWEKGSNEIFGIIVRTEKGEYLLIEKRLKRDY